VYEALVEYRRYLVMNHLCTRRLSIPLTIGIALIVLVSNLAPRAAAQTTVGPNTIDRYVTEQLAAIVPVNLTLSIAAVADSAAHAVVNESWTGAGARLG
jgi:hypothetical protein